MSKVEPLDEIQWKSPEWIQQFGLHSDNVLDYFSESPFYDRTSNNQVIKMQFQFQPIPANVHPQTYMQSKLLEMKGVEFVIAYVKEPDFWIIRKQKRHNPQQVTIQQDYYIIGANIYQSPKIYDILSARFLSSINSVKSSLDILNSISNFNIGNGGHSYPNINDTKPSTSSAMEGTISSSANTGAANTVTPMVSTPTIATPAITHSQLGVGGGSGSATSVTASGAGAVNTVANTNNNGNINTNSSALNNILASTFDGLLNSIINLNDQGTYLDDIPLYGKGSTVEKLDLKVNLN